MVLITGNQQKGCQIFISINLRLWSKVAGINYLFANLCPIDYVWNLCFALGHRYHSDDECYENFFLSGYLHSDNQL